MPSIEFFTPVVYDDPNKTVAQQILETLDEYFYLGGKFRVRIFASGSAHSVGLQESQDRSRSWSNVAIKIASYCTLILPFFGLLCKAVLRDQLQISTIEVQSKFTMNGKMNAKLPAAILGHIGLFLDFNDEHQFMRTAIFARDAIRASQKYYKDLQTKIEVLPKGAFSRKDFQELFMRLITSPADSFKYWALIMDTLMKRLQFGETVDTFIESHEEIAHFLATTEEPVSPARIDQFCKYFARRYASNKTRPWIGYRIFEQYLLKLNAPNIQRALKEYLIEVANTYIQVESRRYELPNSRLLITHRIDIDPRTWFGFIREKNSLWSQHEAEHDKAIFIPEILLEALWTHIQKLRNSYKNYPFTVSMTGRAEAELPRNFTLPLAQRITDAHIFLDHNSTVTKENLRNAEYADYISPYNREQLETLARQYPNAVV